MRFGIMLAAAAAMVAGAGQASAADYLTFTFTVSGMASRDINVSPPGNDIHRKGSLTGAIVLVVPSPAAGASTAGVTIGDLSSLYVENAGLSASDQTLTVSDHYGLRFGSKGDYRTLSLNVCGNFGSVIPTGSVAVDPSCSSASFFQGLFLGSSVGGDGSSFDGTVTDLTVAEGFGTPAAYGLTALPILPVPELTTWAMMIAGFGAIGALARRRSRRRVTAAI